jgi:uncharacterized protein YggE
MKRIICALALVFVGPTTCFAQASGNIAYSQASGSAKAEQNERAKRVISRDEMPPTNGSMFVDASILMNVRATEYMASFGVSQEGTTIEECGQKMDTLLGRFLEDIKALGIGARDVYVDFVAQNRIYGFEVTGEVAKEKLTGFELKKNVSIHFKDMSTLDKLVLAASRSQIHDVIKVDYLVKDTQPIQDRLMAEAARMIKLKRARYERLLGIRLQATGQVYAERPSTYFPTEMYDSYAAFESEDVNAGYNRQKYVIQSARKARTFFFNGLSAKGFDFVVNPIVLEPVVQFTLYLKVKYDTVQGNRPVRTNAK